MEGHFGSKNIWIKNGDKTMIHAAQKDGLYILEHIASELQGKLNACTASTNTRNTSTATPLEIKMANEYPIPELTINNPDLSDKGTDLSEDDLAETKEERARHRLFHRRFGHYSPAIIELRKLNLREERQTGKLLKSARSDNAPELKNIMVQWQNEDGVIAKFTAIASSHQNEPAERSIQTAEMAMRTMIDDAELPIEFWDEAIEYDSYIRNRLPLGPIINGKLTSPIEAYTGVRPNVDRIRHWGYKAYGYKAYGYKAYGYKAYGYKAYGYKAYGYKAYGYKAYGYKAYGYVKSKTLEPRGRHDKLVVNLERVERVNAFLIDEKVRGTIDLQLKNTLTGNQGTSNHLSQRKKRVRPRKDHEPTENEADCVEEVMIDSAPALAPTPAVVLSIGGHRGTGKSAGADWQSKEGMMLPQSGQSVGTRQARYGAHGVPPPNPIQANATNPAFAMHASSNANGPNDDWLNDVVIAATEAAHNETIAIYDTGALHHFVPCESIFSESFTKSKPIKFDQAVGDTVFTRQGTAHVTIGQVTFELRDSLYSPRSSCIIFSAGRLQRLGGIIPDKNMTTLIRKRPDNQDIALARLTRKNDVYYILPIPHSSKLTHIAAPGIARVPKTTSAQRMEGLDTGELTTCETCHFSKAQRYFSYEPRPTPFEPLDEVFINTVGKLTTACNGHQYAVIITDAKSRMRWAITACTKDQIAPELVKWVEHQHHQYGKRVRTIFKDGGSEFSRIKSYCDQHGVRTDFSAPYTPEQNGASEAFNKVILRRARSMLIDAKMPACYWPWAIEHACFITNRLYCLRTKSVPLLSFLQELKKLHPSQVDFTSLPRFGCRTYKLIDPKPGKFEPKSKYGLKRHITQLHQNPIRIPQSESHDVHTVPNSPSSSLTPSSSRDLQVLSRNHDLADQREITNEKRSDEEAELTEDDHYDQVMTGWDPIQPVAGVKRPHLPENGMNRSQRGRAVKRVDYYRLHHAEEKFKSLKQKGSIQIIPNSQLPKGCKPMKCKWVFKKKFLANGDIEKYKARCTAKGFTQRQGIDYHEPFAPTPRPETGRIILVLAHQLGWHRKQGDVLTAFLNPDLNIDLFMELPKGYEKDGYII
ncbi:hypothetical protein K3495_g7446 [Podosphaera aphanis]|nr:hypothetical protein K3495_g7446 [Podosphaera aphanis]